MLDHYHDEDPVPGQLNWSLWRKVLVFAWPYRRWLLALGVVAVVVAFFDVCLVLLPGVVIDDVTAHGREARLGLYAAAFSILIVTFAACIWLFIWLAGRMSTGIGRDIRTASFRKVQELDFAYFDRRPVGWLMARLTSDCNGLSRIMGWALLDIVWGTTLLTGITVTILWLNWKLALAVLAIVPPLLVASRYYQFRLLVSSRAVRKLNSHVTAGFNECITGVRTTKSLVRERRNLEEFQEMSGQMYNDSVRNALYAAAFIPWVLCICSTGVGISLWAGGVAVMDGSMSLGTLVIFIGAAGMYSAPIQEMARTITLIQGAQASAERIQGLLDTEPQIVDRDHEDRPEPHSVVRGEEDRIDTIEFCDVSFAYAGGQPVLHQFNLKVQAGQTIALVGPTGGGKSTIVALACRFYEPVTGAILVNGVDYRQHRLHWLQSKLGIVLQAPHLFSGSIRENIRYGRLDASDDQVEEAARLVHAHDFIADLPEGYDSEVGEGGDQLSTGQKQLVSLARAILADPQIFVMDEATSSVDTEAERLIQDAISRVLAGRISFVIAHRLSTIRGADRILVIEGGRCVESGTHESLMAAQGRYHELYTHQFAEQRSGAHLGR